MTRVTRGRQFGGIARRREQQQPEQIVLDAYVPNWTRRCSACNNKPTVEGVREKQVVRLADLCGPCTFGTARAVDPAAWNSLDDDA